MQLSLMRKLHFGKCFSKRFIFDAIFEKDGAIVQRNVDEAATGEKREGKAAKPTALPWA